MHGYYIHQKDQAQFAICVTVFKGHNEHIFFSFALECESSEHFLFVFVFFVVVFFKPNFLSLGKRNVAVASLCLHGRGPLCIYDSLT